MSNKTINIDNETLLSKFKEEFSVCDIYIDEANVSTLKRQLTYKEKKKISNTFFTRYFLDFFKGRNPESNDFIFGKLKLVQKNSKPYICWYGKQLGEFESNLNIDTENATSDLIFNLSNNYELFHDVSMLQDYEIFKKQNQ